MNIDKLLIVSRNALLDHPTFTVHGWENFSRKAYVEPIVIRDGFHDYVLMSADEYRRLTEPEVMRITISPDMTLVAAALKEMVDSYTPPPMTPEQQADFDSDRYA